MQTSGKHLGKFTKADKEEAQHYTAYTFMFVERHTQDKYFFKYVVPRGKEPHHLVKDLNLLVRQKQQVEVEMREEQGMLKIVSMELSDRHEVQ